MIYCYSQIRCRGMAKENLAEWQWGKENALFHQDKDFCSSFSMLQKIPNYPVLCAEKSKHAMLGYFSVLLGIGKGKGNKTGSRYTCAVHQRSPIPLWTSVENTDNISHPIEPSFLSLLPFATLPSSLATASKAKGAYLLGVHGTPYLT